MMAGKASVKQLSSAYRVALGPLHQRLASLQLSHHGTRTFEETDFILTVALGKVVRNHVT